MITGDHLLTAIHVAKQVFILPSGNADHQIITRDMSREEICKVSASNYLCVEGDPTNVIACGLSKKVAVWARASPSDKRAIVASIDGMTLFCGDGTNDVAALKEAKVGIALMETFQASGRSANLIDKLVKGGIVSRSRNNGVTADDTDMSALIAKPGDASIAAPFAYRGDTIRCVSLLIRSGRASLALVIQMYKILAVNSLITAFSLSVLTLRGVKLGDTQTAIEALVMSLLSFMMSRFPPAKQLPSGEFKPVFSVFKMSVLITIYAQACAHLILVWYGQTVVLDDSTPLTDIDAKFSPSLPNTLAFIQLFSAHLSSSIANFEGPPSLPSIKTSRPVMVLIVVSLLLLVFMSSNGIPELSETLELVDVPETSINTVLGLVFAHLIGGIAIGWGIRQFFERPKSL
jgi:cation-transporting ATPase 13A1